MRAAVFEDLRCHGVAGIHALASEGAVVIIVEALATPARVKQQSIGRGGVLGKERRDPSPILVIEEADRRACDHGCTSSQGNDQNDRQN
jgi:hypothetical protein